MVTDIACDRSTFLHVHVYVFCIGDMKMASEVMGLGDVFTSKGSHCVHCEEYTNTLFEWTGVEERTLERFAQLAQLAQLEVNSLNRCPACDKHFPDGVTETRAEKTDEQEC